MQCPDTIANCIPWREALSLVGRVLMLIEKLKRFRRQR